MAGIDLKLAVSENSRKFARDVASRFPREMMQAVNRTAGIMRSQIRKNMRKGGGADGVPKWADLHTLTDYTRQRFKMSEWGKAITIHRPGKYTRDIGWVDSIAGLAGTFHGGSSYTYDNNQRGALIRQVYRKTGETQSARDIVGRQHEQPSRLLFEPYTAALSDEKIRKWMLGNLAKALEKSAKRHEK